MHQRLLNEVVIDLVIRPDGPILVKAGESQADPTLPDMSFVRTYRNGTETVYLPGSSLKGVLRAHCEKLARTVQVQGAKLLACDPLGENSCGTRLEKIKGLTGDQVHFQSCFVCQIFGNTALASHLRTADAYPDTSPKTEERNGVAIDRVFGSTMPGALFNYEAVITGEFRTTLRLTNLSLAHLGLLALALRDLTEGRIRVGFGKSRGLGAVNAQVNSLTFRYPACDLTAVGLSLPGVAVKPSSSLYGVGEFLGDNHGYGYPVSDASPLPPGHQYISEDDGWFGVVLASPPKPDAKDGVDWKPLGRLCAGQWREWATHG